MVCVFEFVLFGGLSNFKLLIVFRVVLGVKLGSLVFVLNGCVDCCGLLFAVTFVEWALYAVFGLVLGFVG